MHRYASERLLKWHREGVFRKPLIVQGARQVGKSYLVRDFCNTQGFTCLEMNFEKEPSLRKLFVEGHNSKTVNYLEVHFGLKITTNVILFLDEIQSAPEVFARLRYFFEDTPHLAVIAAGSLLEFALAEMAHSIPVGRIEYMHLGPMSFQEMLLALNEHDLLNLLKIWHPKQKDTQIPDVFHDKLMSYVRDFSFVGGMPEAVLKFVEKRDWLGCWNTQNSITETYRNDFAKYRKKIPLERIDRIFTSIPSHVGQKWVHARVCPTDKAQAVDKALDLLCQARVAHKVIHSSGNGVPLAAERKENLFKVIFLDIGLMGHQLGISRIDLNDTKEFERINEGALAEQWVGQHLLMLNKDQSFPCLHYWVREKSGAMAEVDYLIPHGSRIFPLEVKAGSSQKTKSLQVFLSEKHKSILGIHVSGLEAKLDESRRILTIPFYLLEELPRILS